MKLLFLVFVLLTLPQSPVYANPQSFGAWLEEFKRDAAGEGISQSTLSAALSGVQPISRVIELDRKQPEGTLSFAQYRERVINNARIQQGRQMLYDHRAELEAVSAKYGVQPQYIVALWGIETSYGNNTGGFKVVDALATLAYDGRRSSFFRKELINALKIIDEGHINAAQMKGSWAGAMGQNQFMPSSFHAYAVDHNGDGKRDIWGSLPDVFGSTANYLSRSGWHGDERWGREVVLPSGFPQSQTGIEVKKSLREWQAAGVALSGGGALPLAEDMEASIVTPDGAGGPAYLVYHNYSVIMRWNKSVYFATSVGLLADAITE